MNMVLPRATYGNYVSDTSSKMWLLMSEHSKTIKIVESIPCKIELISHMEYNTLLIVRNCILESWNAKLYILH